MSEKFKELYVGQEFKNYNYIAKWLGMTPTKGKGRKYHIEEFDTYCRYEKQGHKFIVTEVFTEKKERIDGRTNNGGNNKKYTPNFNVSAKHYKSIGVYTITLYNDIYIGSTVNSFRTRYLSHTYDDNILPTKNMLKSGATFKIIELCDGMTEESVRQRENYWIQFFKSIEGFNVINKNTTWSYGENKDNKRKDEDIRYIRVKHKHYDNAIKLLNQSGFECY